MDIQKEQQKREEFKNILFDLAQSQNYFQDEINRSAMYERLESLYYSSCKEEQFRHFYSDIFEILSELEEDNAGSREILGQNLGELRKYYEPSNKDENGNLIDIGSSLTKLHDHVSLDIARMSYSDRGDRRLEQEESIENIKSNVGQFKQETETKLQKFEESLQGARNAQKEYIAILGIFSSVVLTFTAGIVFTTSVLQNLHTASIYRVTLMTLLIGLVLANILCLLFYYIDRLVNQGSEKKWKSTYIIIVNIVMVFGILSIVFSWYLGAVESRNLRVKDKETSTITQSAVSSKESYSPKV